MEQLPYIDEYGIDIAAPPAAAWGALLSFVRRELGGPAPGALLRVLDLEPAEVVGDWRGPVRCGHAVPGFEVTDVRPNERLEFSGHHRFSRYALVFELDETGRGAGSRLRAQTYAAFPGIRGRAYRAAVIGSRGHRLLVRRMLRQVAERAT